jgi:hypothetical protein
MPMPVVQASFYGKKNLSVSSFGDMTSRERLEIVLKMIHSSDKTRIV